MSEVDIYKQIISLQEQIQSLANTVSDQADQITKLLEGGTFLLSQIKDHHDLIASVKNDIDNLKAENQRQEESLIFLRQAVSH